MEVKRIGEGVSRVVRRERMSSSLEWRELYVWVSMVMASSKRASDWERVFSVIDEGNESTKVDRVLNIGKETSCI